MHVKFTLKYTLLMSLFLLGGCHLKSTKSDTDPSTEMVSQQKAQAEPAQPEPAQPEPAQAEPAQSEPAQAEPAQSEPAQPEPAQPEPAQPEPAQAEPAQAEPVQAEPVQPEPVQPEPVQPEPAQAEPAQPEPVQPEPAQPESVQPESVQPESVQPESVQPEPVSAKPPQNVPSHTLRGRIQLDQSKLKRQNAEVKNTVVYFEPARGRVSALPTTQEVISTRNKQFKPNVLAITAGSTISFPNMDRILHNVFSVSPESEFDLGLYSAGTSKNVTFDQPGVIYVHCNVHHSMQADILVLDTPYFTQVDEAGYFELTGLPELAGVLKTWHPRANISALPISEQVKPQEIKHTVAITRPEVPKHRNKFGKSYRRARY